jgi:hypothetical protein
MAHLLKSPFISDLRGNLRGSGFQLGVYGLNIRHRRKRKKSISSEERKHLNFTCQLTDIWRSLTLTQKQTWSLWCAWTNQHSKHNASQIITGLCGFVKVNLPRIKCGIAVISYAPLVNTVPIYSSMSLNLTFSGLLYLDSSVVIPVNNFVVVKISQSKEASANITKNECIAINKIFNGGSQWDLQSEYVTLFGNTPIAGERIGLCYSQIDSDSGLRLPETFKVFTL